MSHRDKLNRREFITSAASIAATISIVPSSVIAGTGHVPPSDQLTVANIGCGTQGLREMGDLLKNPKIRLVAVCDVNKSSSDYIDWSPYGIRNTIRETIGDNSWWEGKPGIPGGRDIGQEYVEKYYAKNKPSGRYKGCASYEDYRELLDQEKGIDVVKIMTPDHTHAPIALAAMSKKINVVTHKPIANRLLEGRKVIQKASESGAITHLLAWSDRPEYRQMKAWMDAGLIGDLQEIHNWSYRPVWQQWTSRPTAAQPIPEGFNWQLWLGPVPDMPYTSSTHTTCSAAGTSLAEVPSPTWDITAYFHCLRPWALTAAPFPSGPMARPPGRKSTRSTSGSKMRWPFRLVARSSGSFPSKRLSQPLTSFGTMGA
jgi:hypothetical protein